ncbi:Uma2 family endonuclease [Pseudanabaena sp. UWO311]|uniref:Uma2 family endonuclease n=1 Tax=Pseudanabaena sp. UWO311 TaxID=2487337 RepID=UPI001159CE58|nr:Uma2 family endonuclease [Pseudanabaena sp. UWO311]TYQ28749.1 Uma2 family endonuclease [Pseudanabaena sp. UWO311]
MITLTQPKSGSELEQKLDLSFDKFLEQCPEDGRYELVDGKMVKILATRIHYDVAWLILKSFDREVERLSLNYVVNDVAAVLTTNKNGKEQGRHPDVSVINRDVWRSDRQNHRGIREPIQIAVEVVSTNWEDDYIDKLAEYERLGIPEYWIVDYLAIGSRDYLGDPKLPSVFIFTLDTEGKYQLTRFQNSDRLVSPTFPELNLTVAQIMAA